ncbi:hypothetical protein MRB53_015242 [Persea americana]|uniref:Uncharacterized protein n=1 Tax=Persea americana TaxID=3435 RepID=A0ACC2KDG6_PERAE|nr:hypothetical protein MRB53_015242 [Persea americana]
MGNFFPTLPSPSQEDKDLDLGLDMLSFAGRMILVKQDDLGETRPSKPSYAYASCSSHTEIDFSVAVRSSVSVGAVPLLTFLKEQEIVEKKETLEKIHRAIVWSAYEVLRLKGYTSWAIGYSVASLVRTLLRDQRCTHPVSILAKGFYGIEGGDVFLSLSAQLGCGGGLAATNVPLSDKEAQRFRDPAKAILEVQNQLGV